MGILGVDPRRSSENAQKYALWIVERLSVPDSDPRAGITHPTQAQAAQIEAAVRALPVAECVGRTGIVGWFTSTPAECAEEASAWLSELLPAIPVAPGTVSYAETIASANDAALSSAAWAQARQLRTQLMGAAAMTVEDVGELAPKVGLGVGAVVIALAALYVVSRP